MTVQPNALAAITAALQSKQNPAVVTPVALPVQSAPFTFVPQAAPVPASTQVGPGVAPAPAANPFQPSPAQAAAAFVAAVPRAAEQHIHPQTGVPFAPINPPGEASSAPTNGLDATPVFPTAEQGTTIAPQTVVAPEPAPKAARTRKPRAGATNAGGMPGLVASSEQPAGDGAVVTAEASATPSRTGPQSYTLEEQLAFATVEELTAELKRRGFRIGLSVE